MKCSNKAVFIVIGEKFKYLGKKRLKKQDFTMIQIH